MSQAYADREPVTRRDHDHPWAADLETDKHAANQRLIVAEAIDAIKQTRGGNFVDLVTHGRHGRPSAYLHQALRELNRSIELTKEGRCHCGGYVTRVHVDPPQ